MRRFLLKATAYADNVGVGAEGVQYSDGVVWVHWLIGERPSDQRFDSEQALYAHVQGGTYYANWID